MAENNGCGKDKRGELQRSEASAEEESTAKREQNAAVGFLADVLRGVAIGVAFIIPGFSGGSIAAILGIYEKIVGAIADFFKTFKKSFFTLLPIALGMILGVAALIFPIKWGLSHYPIPTVTLFAGLALGGIPSITRKMRGKPTWKHIVACAVPLAAAASLAFLPLAGEVDLFSLNFGGYLLLILIGAVASCALVVPGISGSMLLLIFGYYNPVIDMITKSLLQGDRIGVCIAVIACLAVGIAIGFFGISVAMKFLLKKFPRGTYFAIFGFVIGSLPAVFASTVRDTASELEGLYSSPWYWVVSVLLLAVGIALSLTLVLYARKKEREKESNAAAR